MRFVFKAKILLLSMVLLGLSSNVFADSLPSWAAEITPLIENGGVYVESSDGKALFNYEGKNNFIPASTLKVATALTALELLGKDYHFKTEFYVDSDSNLYVKGYGDPFLVSEELSQIAKKLKSLRLGGVKNIILDDSYFEKISVPGVSASTNPYDALNSALSANFNTIYVLKTKNGVESAEPQTPITELTRTLAAKAPLGKSRINLAAHPDKSLLYVGYLLKAFLTEQNISIEGEVRPGRVPASLKVFYKHSSSKDLEEVCQAMLKFSTNFIANQIFLVVGAEKMGAPASLAKSKKVMTDYLTNKVGVENFNIEEGSGISRLDKISPYDLVKVLRAFEKYKKLLPEKLEGILAKTGTLNGVSSLTGYFESTQFRQIRFAILLNQKAGNREKIARLLYQNLH